MGKWSDLAQWSQSTVFSENAVDGRDPSLFTATNALIFLFIHSDLYTAQGGDRQISQKQCQNSIPFHSHKLDQLPPLCNRGKVKFGISKPKNVMLCHPGGDC